MTGLNTQRKVVGREQDRGETEKEGEREMERCCKWVVASVINLAVGENIYHGYRRIIKDHEDGH
jgi:hypothetical protein